MTFTDMVSQPVQSRRKGREGTQINHEECTSNLLYKVTGLRLSDFYVGIGKNMFMTKGTNSPAQGDSMHTLKK